MDKASERIVFVSLLLAGGYLAYRYLLKPVTQVAQAAGNALATPVAAVINWWSLPAPINANGQYVLQDSGATIDPSVAPINWINSSDPRAAPYGGQLPIIQVGPNKYVLGPHDDRGNYPAVPL